MGDNEFRSAGERPDPSYDVVIMGGGLAGLTLGRQLKRARPETSVLVAEKRQGPAPDAAFKVGESTVELSAHYFSEVVGMRDHLETGQLPKAGLRYFFPRDGNEDIAARFEFGPADFGVKPAYQLDRGRFENALWRANLESGVHVFDGCVVEGLDLADDGEHSVEISRDGETISVKARWVVDASGRAATLKRKLGLAKDVSHTINSAWLRLAGGIDIDDWSDDPDWHARMVKRGVRGLSTNHLMGEGYWVWLIPLSSGSISVGIVADPRFHPYEEINTIDGSIAWFHEHEPQLGAVIEGRRDQVQDFLRIRDFAFSCERMFSPQRWCLTGEAGAFADPFYSPGSDFIALGNTFITDLVVRDLGGEEIGQRLEFYNGNFLQLFEAYLRLYTDQYAAFGNQNVMPFKLVWEISIYWGINALRFIQGKVTDLQFTQRIGAQLGEVIGLTIRMEELFQAWNRLAPNEERPGFVSPNGIPPVHALQVNLEREIPDDELAEMFVQNAEFLRALAVLIFNAAVRSLPDVTLDEDVKINPFAVSLQPERWEDDGLFDESGTSVAEARERTAGVEENWLDQTVASR